MQEIPGRVYDIRNKWQLAILRVEGVWVYRVYKFIG